MSAAGTHDKQPSYLHGGWGAQIGPDFMWQQLEEGYDTNPDNIALICPDQSSTELQGIVGESPHQNSCLAWTYRQLMIGSKDFAELLSSQGVKKGDSLVAFLRMGAEWALCFWVASTLGLTFVPLNPDTLEARGTQHYPLELLNPAVVLVLTVTEAVVFDELYSDLPQPVAFKMLCYGTHNRVMHPWGSIRQLKCRTDRNQRRGGDKPERRRSLGSSPEHHDRVAVVLFADDSSGDSPRGYPLTVSNIGSALANRHVDPGERFVVTTPSTSIVTLETAMMAWKGGATLVVPGWSLFLEEPYLSFSPENALDAIHLHKCTELVCTPAHLKSMIRTPYLSGVKARHLGRVTVAGDIASPSLRAEAKGAMKVGSVRNRLTMNEGFGSIGWNIAPHDNTPDSIGFMLWDSKAKVCDGQRRILAKHEHGILHVGGNTIIQGYLGGKVKKPLYQDEDGEIWLDTGYTAKVGQNDLVYLIGPEEQVSEHGEQSLEERCLALERKLAKKEEKCSALAKKQAESEAVMQRLRDQVTALESRQDSCVNCMQKRVQQQGQQEEMEF